MSSKNSNDGTSSMAPTRTYLRVKRPRTTEPLPFLRLDGLDGNKKSKNADEALANLMHQSTYIAQQHPKQPPACSSAVWKRVEKVEEPSSASHKRPFRVVDAVLDEQPCQKKRRLLTLVAAEKTPPKKNKAVAPNKHVIIDPLHQLIQDSLEQVLSGDKTVLQHLEFISHDERLSSESHAILWMDVRGGAGNILHAAVLVNDLESVSTLITSKDVNALASAVNSHGQTPYQLAMILGNEQVSKVLDFSSQNDEKEEDKDAYVYDVFMLDTETDTKEAPAVELRGGIGYWNEEGELILEALEDYDQNVDDDDSQDDEEDSNAEDYQGNDYPDEEEQDFSVDDEDDTNFRHCPVYLTGVRIDSKPHAAFGDENDDEYDAQYGLYNGNSDHSYNAEVGDFDSDTE